MDTFSNPYNPANPIGIYNSNSSESVATVQKCENLQKSYDNEAGYITLSILLFILLVIVSVGEYFRRKKD